MPDPHSSSHPGAPHAPAVISRRAVLTGALQALALLAACSAPLPQSLATATGLPVQRETGAGPSPEPVAPGENQARPATAPGSATPGPQTTLAPGETSCLVAPVTVPTPIPYPGYSRMEPSTGLHVTGEAQPVDLPTWRLKVTGKVDRPLALTYDELRCLPKVGSKVRLDCPGFFTDWSDLAGPTMATVIGPAGPQQDVKTLVLRSVDGHVITLGSDAALAPENFLAYEWEDEVLPPSHGFPLRAVLPGQAGGNWLKWLVEIELS